MPTPKLTLSYFAIEARAAPIRLAAVIGKVPFTNEVVDFKDWPATKPSVPLGRLPMLEIGQEGKETVRLTQSIAILRYMGRLSKLYPEDDPVKALQIDSYMDCIGDASRGIELSLAGAVKSLASTKEWTEEEKLAFRKRLTEDKQNGLPYYFSFLEQELVKNGTGYLVGDSLTIVDLLLYRMVVWISSGILTGIPKEFFEAYPATTKLRETIDAMPQVAAFREKYPAPYSTFDYDPSV